MIYLLAQCVAQPHQAFARTIKLKARISLETPGIEFAEKRTEID
jgi:hypothetical protein